MKRILLRNIILSVLGILLIASCKMEEEYPTKPTGIQAIYNEEEAYVEITWNETSGAEYYQLFRCNYDNYDSIGIYRSNYIGVNAEGNYELDDDSNDWKIYGTKLIDNYINPGEKFYYVIYASNDGGSSDYSDFAEAARPELEAPTNFKAVYDGISGHVNLSWDKVPSAEFYDIRRAESEDADFSTAYMSWRLIDGTYQSVNDTVWRIYDTKAIDVIVEPGKDYYYRVLGYVVSSHDTALIYKGTFSDIQSAHTTPDSIAAPTGVQAKYVEDKGVEITWNIVEGATGYDVYRSAQGDEEYQFVYNTQENSIIDGIDIPGTWYYMVLAYNDFVASYFSSVISVTIEDKSPPVAPQNVVATYNDQSTNIDLVWDAVPDAVEYKIYTVVDGISTFLSSAGTATSAEILNTSDWEPGEKCYVVTALNSSGIDGEFSTTACATIPTPIPGTPQNFSANYNDVNGNIDINWDAVEGAVEYIVYWTIDYVNYTPVGSTETQTITGTYFEEPNNPDWNPGELCFAATAVNTYDVEGDLSSYDCTSIPLPIPEKPQNVSAVYNTNTTNIDINWDAVEGADYYNVYWDGDLSTVLGLVYSTSFEELNNSSWSDNDNICFVVEAVNTSGTSAFSESNCATIDYPSTEIPAAPSNVFASYNSTSSCIDITWDLVTNATEYQLYYSTEEYGVYTSTGTTTAVGSDSDCAVNPGETWYYKVKAINANGESDFSTASWATVPLSKKHSDSNNKKIRNKVLTK